MEEIEVPCHFLCPISLRLMRDPVTISTGITYDRESIEKWLFTFNNTCCPVSKQPLFDSYLTPNHTLRRFIQSWCTLNSVYGIERIPTPKQPINKTQIVKIINEAKNSPNNQIKCLQKLKSIASQSETNKNCLESAGAIEYLTSVLKQQIFSDNCYTSTTLVLLLEVVIELLFILRSEFGLHFKNMIRSENDIIETFVQALKCREINHQSRAYVTMLLKTIFDLADPLQLTSVKKELFEEIVNYVNLRDHSQLSQQGLKASLKLLVEICPWGRNRVKAVEGGTIMMLIELLLHECTYERRICELVLIVLDQLCRCAEGRAELLNHGAGLAIVSKKIFRVSYVVNDRGVRILSSISRFCANPRVLQEMLQVGVVAKLCLVLQEDCSLKTKERAKEILKLHARIWKNSTCIPSHLLSSYPY